MYLRDRLHYCRPDFGYVRPHFGQVGDALPVQDSVHRVGAETLPVDACGHRDVRLWYPGRTGLDGVLPNSMPDGLIYHAAIIARREGLKGDYGNHIFIGSSERLHVFEPPGRGSDQT